MEDYDFYKRAGKPVRFTEIKNAPADQIINISRWPRIQLRGITSPPSGEEGSSIRELSDAQVVKVAGQYFNTFGCMYVDMVYCCHQRKESRDFFIHISPESAFRVLETEMKFGYEAFYTKTPLLSSVFWMIIRVLSISMELIAAVTWFYGYSLYKDTLPSIDILITNGLLIGAIFIDIMAFIRLLFSDWMISWFEIEDSYRKKLSAFLVLLFVRRRRWGENPKKKTSCFQKLLRLFFRQWSESISQFNFIHYCIDERCYYCNSLYDLIGAKDTMDGWKYVSKQWLTNGLRNFIFEEIRGKSNMAENHDMWDEVSSSRGNWILSYYASNSLDPATFERWITDVEYDESLLNWHIATELCYQTEEEPDDNDEKMHREFSKILSDYMLYLVLQQPMLMLEMTPMALAIFNDTSEEARLFFHEVMASSPANSNCIPKKNKKNHKEACQRIMEVITDIPPSYIKEDDNNSVLFDACALAKELIGVKNSRWKLISKIWVELLCFAAAHSKGSDHAVLLCEGGELVTLVKLLMLHLGLSNQFHTVKSATRSELVVDM